jgi:hypothetical protein
MQEFFIGDPDYQMEHWELQNLPDNCGVVAQSSILSQFGLDVSMDEATYVAMANGWYTPGFGTSPDDLGNVLEAYGVPTHSVDYATIEQLAAELQQGHRVLVGVNSGELWEQGPMADFWNWFNEVTGRDSSTLAPADHAVAVIGLDLSDLGNPQVILNDPGHPDGAGQTYPLDQFMDAWENSDFHYTSTSIAPMGTGPLEFNIAQFLGWGTTAAGVAFGFDPITANAAGVVVNSIVSDTNWDAVLTAI